MAKSSVKGPLWNYFIPLDNDSEKAKCNLCHNIYSRKGRSTTNLRNHLRGKHTEEFKQVEETEKIQFKEKLNPKKETALQEAKAGAKSLQSGCITSWLDKDTTQKFDYLIGEMICLDYLPFSHVEGLGFMRLMTNAVPRYNLKKRNFYTNLICTKMYNSTCQVIKTEIQNLPNKLSFTTDEWSDVSAGVSLLSLTCHGITENFQRVSFILSATPLDERHTGHYISEKFLELLKFWDIPLTKIHAVMRDAGSNMVKALKLADVTSFHCTAHKVQLVVNEGLKSYTQRKVSDIASKCRRIATHFNHSIAAQDELAKIKKKHNLPLLKMQQDVPTRWNSTLHMFKRTIEIKEALIDYASKCTAVDLPILDGTEWDIINKCIVALDPFEQITKKLSESLASIGDVIPLIRSLKKICEERDDRTDIGILTMKNVFKAELHRRFIDIENEIYYTVSTYLDPRYKAKFFSSSDLKRQIQKDVARLCLEEHKKTADDEDDESVVQSSKRLRVMSTDDNGNNPSKKPKSLQDTLVELMSEDDDSDTEGATESCMHKKEIEIIISSNIAEYHKEKPIEITSDPLVWWNSNKLKYPLLCKVARNFLSCPPTSVPSEQLFSGAGQIYDSSRTRLQGEKAEKLLFLKYNLPIIKFDYEKPKS